MSDPVELLPTESLKDGWAAQDQVYEGGWWFQKYWDSTEGSQRDAIVGCLERVGSFASVLEIGCNTGPNLRRIHARWPAVDLYGMDIHPGAIRYGQLRAKDEGWRWIGYQGDLRDLHLLGPAVADVVLSCYSLAYLDPRDINGVLAAALACAKTALILCEPMVAEDNENELYVLPSKGMVAEYHYNYAGRLACLGCASTRRPITPPHGRLNAVLTVLKG